MPQPLLSLELGGAMDLHVLVLPVECGGDDLMDAIGQWAYLVNSRMMDVAREITLTPIDDWEWVLIHWRAGPGPEAIKKMFEEMGE